MDSKITMRNNKTEMLAHIQQLEHRLERGGRELTVLRHRVSILEGEKALRRPAAGSMSIERLGQRTVKRWTPHTPPPIAQRDEQGS